MKRSLGKDLETLKELKTQSQQKLQRGFKHRGVESLEYEFLSEVALSLKRAEDKLLKAIQACDTIKMALDAEDTPSTACIDAYNSACAAVRVARWEMIVHREAVGLRDSGLIRELYPLPRPYVRQTPT